VYSYRVSFPSPADAPGVPKKLKPIFIERETPIEVGSRIEHHGRQWVVTLGPVDQVTFDTYLDVEVWPAEA
jgi:hypothetical protein